MLTLPHVIMTADGDWDPCLHDDAHLSTQELLRWLPSTLIQETDDFYSPQGDITRTEPYRAHRSISWSSSIDDSGQNPASPSISQIPISDHVLHQVFGNISPRDEILFKYPISDSTESFGELHDPANRTENRTVNVAAENRTKALAENQTNDLHQLAEDQTEALSETQTDNLNQVESALAKNRTGNLNQVESALAENQTDDLNQVESALARNRTDDLWTLDFTQASSNNSISASDLTVTETSSTSGIESNKIESNESSSCQVESTESSVSQIESRESDETTSQSTVSQAELPESSNESPISQASINVESSKSSPSQELLAEPTTVEPNDNEAEPEFMDMIVREQEFFFSCIRS